MWDPLPGERWAEAKVEADNGREVGNRVETDSAPPNCVAVRERRDMVELSRFFVPRRFFSAGTCSSDFMLVFIFKFGRAARW